MDRYIFTLKYNGRLDVPDEKDNRDTAVVEELQDLLLKDEIEYHGWNKDHHDLEFDSGAHDLADPLFADETVFEIRMPVDVDIQALYTDDGRKALQYISASLDFRPYHISSCYDLEYGDFVKTHIEITVTSNAEL